ncbi:hypothetical protein K8R42_03070 [bacterium]|nr:hypothetical protein [bacterium]
MTVAMLLYNTVELAKTLSEHSESKGKASRPLTP